MTAARISPGGKGVFVVHPPPGASGCTIAVPNATAPIECDSQYVVACDAALPDTEQFCYLETEVSPVRESIYPQVKRP